MNSTFLLICVLCFLYLTGVVCCELHLAAALSCFSRSALGWFIPSIWTMADKSDVNATRNSPSLGGSQQLKNTSRGILPIRI